MAKNVLARANARALDDWLALRPGFVFDYDGTLSPMFQHPADAFMRQRTRASFAALAAHAPCAVLTGRPVADARVFVGDLPLRAIVGNHGAEWSDGSGSQARLSAAVRATVLRWAASEPGVVIEDKAGFGMSIHWRAAPRDRWGAIRVFTESLKGVAVVPGHRVFNLLPRGAPNKADALPALRKRLGRERLVFVGDDVTDEYAFRLAAKPGSEWLFCIRVGLLRTSAAPWFITDQRAIDQLLMRLSGRQADLDETGGSKRR